MAYFSSSRRLAGAAIFSGYFLPGAGTSSYFRRPVPPPA
jgi:hypothetical protein